MAAHDLARAASPRHRRLDGAGGGADAEQVHFHRQRKGAQGLDVLGGVGNHDHAVACDRDDLLAQQRGTAALDEAQASIDLVGPVDGEIEFGQVFEGGERDALALAGDAGRLRGRHAGHFEPRAHALTQQLDEGRGRAARADAEAHPVLDQGDRALGRRPLQIRRAHETTSGSEFIGGTRTIEAGAANLGRLGRQALARLPATVKDGC